MTVRRIKTPAPYGEPFYGCISHPDLYLWDAWSYEDDKALHLYCLAINKTQPNGDKLLPADKDNYLFHTRHFHSSDNGASWQDAGAFQQPLHTNDGHDARNIWSGSIEPLADGNKLVGFTGIFEVDDQRQYLQNISLAKTADGNQVEWFLDSPLSCPVRDRTQILEAGYYLDIAERLGHKDGEEGGPIMTWRDPYIFVDDNDQIHVFWAAKSGPTTPAIAHGLIKLGPKGYFLEHLYAPISLPDGDSFTQGELPKIYHDKLNETFYLVISTCKRLYEAQPESEVERALRLYKSESLRGPWVPANGQDSLIDGADGMFGMTVLRTDFENNRLLCISPRTSAVDAEQAFTFSETFYLDLISASVSQ